MESGPQRRTGIVGQIVSDPVIRLLTKGIFAPPIARNDSGVLVFLAVPT